MEKKLAGKLYVIATPIGNLGDITLRALEVLKQVDLIAAEDTRHTRKLLVHYGINKELKSYHAHNEAQASQQLMERLLGGESIGLVSDAGTPLISDPGGRLVQMAVERQVETVAIPGPCAVIAALSIAGLDTSRFAFFGFVPSAKKARQTWLKALSEQSMTTVFYESPHRLVATLESMGKCIEPDRQVTVARELTKQYEERWTGTMAALAERRLSGGLVIKGEFVLLLEGMESYQERVAATSSQEEGRVVSSDEAEWLSLLSGSLSKADAAALLARKTGQPKRLYYNWLLKAD